MNRATVSVQQMMLALYCDEYSADSYSGRYNGEDRVTRHILYGRMFRQPASYVASLRSTARTLLCSAPRP